MTAAQDIGYDIFTSKDVFSFGPFRLMPSARRLERDGVPVQLGGRAFDILLILVANAYEIVGKAALLKHAWQNVNVDEGNLRFQVNTLRKALRDDGPNPTYVATVQGQGYRFIASVSRAPADLAPAPTLRAVALSQGLPVRRLKLLGRDKDVETILTLLKDKRFVTLVGAGGVGKTSVAVAVVQSLVEEGDAEFLFLDFGSLAEPTLVGSAIAAALGIPVYSSDPLPSIAAQLESRRLLLIFDCCEHLIDAVALVADRIAAVARDVRILATSREPLRVESECVFRLAPLAFPPKALARVSDPMAYPAVQLFIQRVSMSVNGYVMQEGDAEAIALICRRLDGLPLAIEFAAGQVAAFGMKRLTELLQNKLSLLWQGQRTALPRHQTLNATLDWSFALLSEIEKKVLSRIAVFVGTFTIDAVTSVLSAEDLDATEIGTAIGNLVAKSLISADVSREDGPRYRLLDVTRTYAMQKLEEVGELPNLRFRHARFIHDTLARNEPFDRRKAGSLSGAIADLDDIRAALDWAFSPSGDPAVAVGLAAASAQIWLGVGLLVECRELMRKAVGYLQAGGAEPRQEMRIQIALGASLMFTVGIGDEFEATFSRVFSIAEHIGDVEGQMTALLPLWGQQIREPDFQKALKLARRCLEVAKGTGDRGSIALGDWMMGLCLHHMGHHSEARSHLQQSLAGDVEVSRQAQLALIGYDRKVDALGVLSNALWAQGFADQALRLSNLSVTEASLLDYPITTCVSGAWHGFNSYLTTSDFLSTEAELNKLLEHSRKNAIESYEGLAICLAALCRAQQEPVEVIAQTVTHGLNLLERSKYKVFHPIFRAWTAELFASAGQLIESEIFLTAAQTEDQNQEYWCRPEILRIAGEVHLVRGDEKSAEKNFIDAMNLAASQGALAWQLRAATSAAKLLLSKGFHGKAHAALEPVFSRFEEGFATRDYIAARALLLSIEGD